MKGLRLGRRGKIVRNLLLVVLLWVGIWIHYGAPYPTAELELRRLERENILSSGEIVFWHEGTGERSAHMIRVSEDRVISSAYICGGGESKGIAVYPRMEGPMPVMLQLHLGREDEEGIVRWGEGLVLIQTPEEAAIAELEIQWAHWQGPKGGGAFRESRREDGTFCFWFDPDAVDVNGEPIGFNWSLEGEAYILRLYRENGSLLEEREGYIPKGVFAQSYSSG